MLHLTQPHTLKVKALTVFVTTVTPLKTDSNTPGVPPGKNTLFLLFKNQTDYHKTLTMSILSYLLHDFDTSKEIATRCQSQCRIQHMLGCTGLCCPTWACHCRPVPPASPDPYG